MTANAFHDFEHAGWERASEHYGDAFGALTIQTADALLNAAGVTSSTRLLDVATGPGFIACAAAAREATVVGIDFSQAMIAEARRRHPAITLPSVTPAPQAGGRPSRPPAHGQLCDVL